MGMPLHAAVEAAALALRNAGLQGRATGPDRWEGQEVPAGMFSFTNPVQVNIRFSQAGESTAVKVQVSNFGFGPVQSKHVAKWADKISEILKQAGPVSAPVPDHPRVVINGKELSAEKLNALSQRFRIRFMPGEYWYDGISGAWGRQSGPAEGFAPPGLDFAPLPSDASGGGTGVFINGRELHPLDVARIASITGSVIPGRFRMDALGNIGYEGHPPLMNLWVMAAQQQASARKEGILSTYDKTGIAVIGG